MLLTNDLSSIIYSGPIKIVLSNTSLETKRIDIKRVKDNYLASEYRLNKVFNKNIKGEEELFNYICSWLKDFKQVNITTNETLFQFKESKNGKVLVSKSKNNLMLTQDQTYNREKNYILKEGENAPFLVDMGIMSPSNKLLSSGQKKFRQINKFLELLDDCFKEPPQKLNIIDFGCGKSYLTFVVYYFFEKIKHINVSITGLDLKNDVIDNCNALALKYGYKNLKFICGDIKDYEQTGEIDLVMTLHACDTATDYALYNAIKWNAKHIFSVPCCQHELNAQFKPKSLSILSRYGIAQERTSAIFTDVIRCNLLRAYGYKVDLIEFIDFEHTPKNLLIRASKTNTPKDVKDKMIKEVEELENEFGLNQKLHTLLKENH